MMHDIKTKNNFFSSKYSLFALLFVLVQSCAQTPIGEELSRSFDSPSEEINDSNVLIEEDLSIESVEVITIGDDQSLVQVEKNDEEPELVVINELNDIESQIDSQIAEYTPQPYRITIKLSSANPSAPAESVTKVLRMSGVLFEVEKIERIEPKLFANKVDFNDLPK